MRADGRALGAGSYSYVAVGASGRTYDQLAAPVRRRVLFAGEHTCKVRCSPCYLSAEWRSNGHLRGEGLKCLPNASGPENMVKQLHWLHRGGLHGRAGAPRHGGRRHADRRARGGARSEPVARRRRSLRRSRSGRHRHRAAGQAAHGASRPLCCPRDALATLCTCGLVPPTGARIQSRCGRRVVVRVAASMHAACSGIAKFAGLGNRTHGSGAAVALSAACMLSQAQAEKERRPRKRQAEDDGSGAPRVLRRAAASCGR